MLTKRERAAIKCAERRYNFSELFLFLVLRRPHKGLTVLRDIRYGEGKRAFFDLVLPEGGGQGSPVFVYIHGGGFVSGRRHNRLYYCYEWADKGYVCANMDYDYALDAAHPEHLRELFTGLDRALTEAEKAGADTSRVVIAGDSAGGYFTAMLAAVSTHPELYEKFGIEFSRQETFRPAACITISGLFDPVRAVGTRYPEMALFTRALLGMSQKEIDEAKGDEEFERFVSAERYADAAMPPFMVVRSSADRLRSESESFAAALTAAGVPCRTFLTKGINGVHAGALACRLAKSGRDCLAAALDFAASATGGRLPAAEQGEDTNG